MFTAALPKEPPAQWNGDLPWRALSKSRWTRRNGARKYRRSTSEEQMPVTVPLLVRSGEHVDHACLQPGCRLSSAGGSARNTDCRRGQTDHTGRASAGRLPAGGSSGVRNAGNPTGLHPPQASAATINQRVSWTVEYESDPGASRYPAIATVRPHRLAARDRKSTRLNSSHQIISYAV